MTKADLIDRRRRTSEAAAWARRAARRPDVRLHGRRAPTGRGHRDPRLRQLLHPRVQGISGAQPAHGRGGARQARSGSRSSRSAKSCASASTPREAGTRRPSPCGDGGRTGGTRRATAELLVPGRLRGSLRSGHAPGRCRPACPSARRRASLSVLRISSARANSLAARAAVRAAIWASTAAGSMPRRRHRRAAPREQELGGRAAEDAQRRAAGREIAAQARQRPPAHVLGRRLRLVEQLVREHERVVEVTHGRRRVEVVVHGLAKRRERAIGRRDDLARELRLADRAGLREIEALERAVEVLEAILGRDRDPGRCRRPRRPCRS